MSSVPPISEVISAASTVLIPAFGVAAGAGCLIPAVFGRRSAVIAAAIAILLGLGTANALRGVFTLRFDSEVPLTAAEFRRGFNEALMGTPKSGTDAPSETVHRPRPGRYWIPCAVVVSVVGGLIANSFRWPFAIGLAIRFALAMLATLLFVPTELSSSHLWLPWLIGTCITASWLVCDRLRDQGWEELALACLVLAAMASAFVLLHAHSARLTDAATLIAAAMSGIAVASIWGKADAAGAIPAAVVFLPAVLISGYHETFSDVPILAFILPSVAPLALGLLLLLPEKLVQAHRAGLPRRY